MQKCPGQDTQFWTPEDIFEVPCPACGAVVEFFRDDVTRRCRRCGYRFRTPRLDLACAEWCKYADRCVPHLAGGGVVPEDPPLKARLLEALRERFPEPPEHLRRAAELIDGVRDALPAHPGADPEIAAGAAALLPFLARRVPEGELEALLRKAGMAEESLQRALALLRETASDGSPPVVPDGDLPGRLLDGSVRDGGDR